jgi:MYXO-CTERM domain-containing protein
MNTLHRLLALPVLALTVATAHAGTFANINLDGNTSDWSGIAASATNTGSGPIDQIFLANNDTHLFVRITFNTPVNILTDGFNLNIDNDNNTGTGFNTYSLGLIGSEVLYEGEYAYQQANGNYNTGATTNAPLLIALYGQSVSSLEFGIVRTSVINTGTSALVFPNDTFKLASYFSSGSGTFTLTDAYTFATSAVPEPSTYAAAAGLGVLVLAAVRRRR